MTNDSEVDVVVIGAGPSGSAAAVTALSEGACVAIIDKSTFPRNKLCGGLITGRCARHLREVFNQHIDPDVFETRRNFEFFMDGTRLADMHDVPPAYLTMRWDLDHLLFRQAIEKGAQDFSGHRIEALNLKARTVRLTTGTTLKFSCLIGADGVRSQVAQLLFGESFDTEKIGFALEIEEQSQAPDIDTPIRVDFAAASWGYGWSFPKRRSTTIGVGGLQRENPDMKARLAGYLTTLGTGEAAKVKGHFLPFGGFRKRPGHGAVLLAGDAAGFVDPITGEGIGYAIQSGALAGRAAAHAVAKGKPESAFATYLPATRSIRIALRSAQVLRPIIFAERMKPFFASTFRASRTLKSEYMTLLAGDTEYPAIVSRAFLRLPVAGLRFAWRKLARSDYTA